MNPDQFPFVSECTRPGGISQCSDILQNNTHLWISSVLMAGKGPGHFGLGTTFCIKKVALESVNDSIFHLASILHVAPTTFLAMNKIAVLVSTIGDGVILLFVG